MISLTKPKPKRSVFVPLEPLICVLSKAPFPLLEPLIRLMIKHGLLNLRMQLSVLQLADPLTHLVFKEEHSKRYKKLSLKQKVKYAFRDRVLIQGYAYNRYVNNLYKEFADRRMHMATKYQIKHGKNHADQQPIEVLKHITENLNKNKFKLYSNYSYPWKDQSSNFKKEQEKTLF